MTALIPVGAEQAWRPLSAALGGLTPACQSDPEAWFAAEPTAAVRACLRCPALDPCRVYAQTARERAGVWGGVICTYWLPASVRRTGILEQTA
jgi:hypothetical protein